MSIGASHTQGCRRAAARDLIVSASVAFRRRPRTLSCLCGSATDTALISITLNDGLFGEMKRQHMMWYAAGLIAVAGTALVLGAPASAVLLALAVLACPVMMMLMMSGGRGNGTDHDAGDTNETHNPSR